MAGTDWEYTTAATKNNPRWGYEHRIVRAILLRNGEIYLLTVMVNSDTRSALNRDWAKIRPTSTQILDSVRLTP